MDEKEKEAVSLFVRRYALRSAFRAFSHWPGKDPEDVAQNVLAEFLAVPYLQSCTVEQLKNPSSEEHASLMKVVWRVIQRERRDLFSKHQELIEAAKEHDSHPLQLDVRNAIAGLFQKEQLILQMRLEGSTFEEIGEELELSKQTVHERYSLAKQRMVEILRAYML